MAPRKSYIAARMAVLVLPLLPMFDHELLQTRAANSIAARTESTGTVRRADRRRMQCARPVKNTVLIHA